MLSLNSVDWIFAEIPEISKNPWKNWIYFEWTSIALKIWIEKNNWNLLETNSQRVIFSHKKQRFFFFGRFQNEWKCHHWKPIEKCWRFFSCCLPIKQRAFGRNRPTLVLLQQFLQFTFGPLYRVPYISVDLCLSIWDRLCLEFFKFVAMQIWHIC